MRNTLKIMRCFFHCEKRVVYLMRLPVPSNLSRIFLKSQEHITRTAPQPRGGKSTTEREVDRLKRKQVVVLVVVVVAAVVAVVW